MDGLVNQLAEVYFVRSMRSTRLGKLGRGCINFKFLFPVFKCLCCFPVPEMMIHVGDTDYVEANASTQRWYNGDLISSFGILVAHCAHIKKHQGQWDLPQLLHVTYPKEKLKRAVGEKHARMRDLVAWVEHPWQQPEFIKAHSKQTGEQMRGLIARAEHWYSQSTATVWVWNTTSL